MKRPKWCARQSWPRAVVSVFSIARDVLKCGEFWYLLLRAVMIVAQWLGQQ